MQGRPFGCSYRRFSRLLLKSLIMSERKSLLTSISSALGEEFFSRVATTFRITGWEAKSGNGDGTGKRKEMRGWEKQMHKEYFE